VNFHAAIIREQKLEARSEILGWFLTAGSYKIAKDNENLPSRVSLYGMCVKLSSVLVGPNPVLISLSQAKYNYHLNVPNSRPAG
jgi:hypothetical protein